jgi:hypothetical protein
LLSHSVLCGWVEEAVEARSRGGRGAHRWGGMGQRRQWWCGVEEAGVLTGGEEVRGMGGSDAHWWGGTGWKRQGHAQVGRR